MQKVEGQGHMGQRQIWRPGGGIIYDPFELSSILVGYFLEMTSANSTVYLLMYWLHLAILTGRSFSYILQKKIL